MKKYYELLGVPLGTSIDNIKKHFRQLAIKHHPDKGGDPKRFQELTQAYNILLGKQKLSKNEIRNQQENKTTITSQDGKIYTEEDWKRQEEEFFREIRKKKVAQSGNRSCHNCFGVGFVNISCKDCYPGRKTTSCAHKDRERCIVCEGRSS